MAKEREALQALVTKRNSPAIQVKRAYLLLAADETGEPNRTDEQIRATYQNRFPNVLIGSPLPTGNVSDGVQIPSR